MNLAFQAANIPADTAFHRFVSAAAAPVKFMIRRNIGERQVLLIQQLSGFFLAIAILILHAVFLIPLEIAQRAADPFAGLSSYGRPAPEPTQSLIGFHNGIGAYFWAVVFICLSWVFFIRRHRECEAHIRAGKRWYSGYIGDFLLWKLIGKRFSKSKHETETFVVFGEPGLVALAGLIIAFTWSTPLGWYLVISAVALCFDAASILARERNQYLDAIDAGIMSAQLRAALVEGRPPSETEGFSVPAGLPMMTTIGERETLAEIIERTNPALRAMLDPLPATEDAIGPGPMNANPRVLLDPLPEGTANPLP